ncbi:MAG TPA: hypothetical protein VK473_09290 [Terriglobales bacterium]|nr:hypothetical protein [Terriglobales bacterium]
MNHQPGSPFDSIESAYDFLDLLSEVVVETKKTINEDVQGESSSKAPRRLDALRLAFYNLEKLELHLNRSVRILNDLRSLRRLLFEERKPSVPAAKPVPEAQTQKAVRVLVPSLPAPAGQPEAGRSTAVAA